MRPLVPPARVPGGGGLLLRRCERAALARPAQAVPAVLRSACMAAEPPPGAQVEGAAEREAGGMQALSPGQALWRTVRATYEAAERSGAIYRIRTHASALLDQASGFAFSLQISDALRDKPKPPRAAQVVGPADAFEQPDADLTVERALTAGHTLRLNKFNVLPFHSLVITRAFEPQTARLTQADWAATLLALQAYPEKAMAFFNAGVTAGSSQPRKHLQLIPLTVEGQSTAPLPLHAAAAAACQGGRPLQAAAVAALPFQCFAAALPPRPEATQLQQAYEALLAARPSSSRDADHNLLLTAELMLLVPRSRDACGPVGCNSLAFAGTFLVRSVEELEFVRRTGPLAILRAVTLPWDLAN